MRLVAALLFAGIACTARGPTEVELSAGRRILFVGNSLTYANDLPTTCAEDESHYSHRSHSEVVAP